MPPCSEGGGGPTGLSFISSYTVPGQPCVYLQTSHRPHLLHLVYVNVSSFWEAEGGESGRCSGPYIPLCLCLHRWDQTQASAEG